ncbi:WYL domain-containing protein [Desulfovibrio sp.]|uniref:helix-turn-helix transcriptional regulator n=1 Tax=Desulfovibrio sp. TaxID=885 RepID=UPI0023CF6219|nr:WYL domain-containing protein [Desulfovibrio sp.]MDE7241524.1 WYL domain-containing protein [Desulfovibrio sp.]
MPMPKKTRASSKISSPETPETARTLRLLHIMQEIRNVPAQSLETILKTFGISRSQFYKDKDALASLGFCFEYRKDSGFRITEDRLTPIHDLSLSDRVILLFALEYLSTSGDGLLAAKAIEVGRKLAGGLENPFREQLLQCFDSEVTEKTYGVKPEIFLALTDAVKEGKRIRMLYCRSGTWTESWREVDPRRIYLRQRALYLYARTVDETPPAWKVFRLNRIREIQPTGICLPPAPNADDGFCERQKNAFLAFLGETPKTLTLRFTGEAVPYVRECQWHESQHLEEQPDGSLLLTVSVAEPMEVVRWARQFGDDFKIVNCT